ncbi:MAG: hypothetical protein ACXABD_22290, partial [Candidatus Thorarchaeota archaeon]
KRNKARLVIQNPTYHFPKEHKAEFIPHAVNTEKLRPIPLADRRPNTIGCYKPKHNKTTAHRDIDLLGDILKDRFPKWHFALNERMDWEDRMALMPECMFFFEYMDPNMGYWGRSALEACSMGIPTFSYVSDRALEYSQGRFGKPAIIHICRENIHEIINWALTLDPEGYMTISNQSRNWVQKYYSYQAVGELYCFLICFDINLGRNGKY